MEINISKSQIKNIHALVADIKNGAKKVLVTSINKTLFTVKVQAVARIGNEINLKAGRIKQDFKIEKANYSKISGAVTAAGKPVGLVNFGARQVQKGVSVKVLRSGSRTLLKHAYIATGRGKGNGKTHIFWRAGRNKMPQAKRFTVGHRAKAFWDRIGDQYRIPVERKTGPRIEDIFVKPKVMDPVMTQANHLFLKNMDTKITEILRRHASG